MSVSNLSLHLPNGRGIPRSLAHPGQGLNSEAPGSTGLRPDFHLCGGFVLLAINRSNCPFVGLTAPWRGASPALPARSLIERGAVPPRTAPAQPPARRSRQALHAMNTVVPWQAPAISNGREQATDGLRWSANLTERSIEPLAGPSRRPRVAEPVAHRARNRSSRWWPVRARPCRTAPVSG
jgi:hypothetical protein